jgi:tungstate transport system substrate-binding protein
MTRRLAALLCTLALAPSCAGEGRTQFVLVTTTSVGNAGLLDALLPRYEREHGVRFGVHLVGSGRALAMLASQQGDVAISHAPDAEDAALREHPDWWYRKVMFNDFLVVGPPGDPARARGQALDEALRRIAASAAGWVSRADRSGTHERERALWTSLDIKPIPTLPTGQGMANTLRIASERGAYTLTDRATWMKFAGSLQLAPVSEGDPRLLNTYAIIVGTGEHRDEALAFARWIAEGPGRELIATVPGFTPWPEGAPGSTPNSQLPTPK